MDINENLNNALSQAERFLALREHNEKELALKLYAKGYDKEVIQEALTYLKDHNLLNEARYVSCFVLSNNRRHPEGKSMVLARLASHGADSLVSSSVVNSIYTEEYINSLLDLALEKLKKKSKDNIYNELQKRGFTLSQIRRNVENGGTLL